MRCITWICMDTHLPFLTNYHKPHMTNALAIADTTAVNTFIDIDNYDKAITAGRYTVRFARTSAELAMAQQLRYEVLYKESGGQPSAKMQAKQREEDQWDDVGLHVIVFEHGKKSNGQNSIGQTKVVGTVRLVPKRLLNDKPLYTETSFNLERVFQKFDNALEISRFCIHPNGRAGSILMLIWKFALEYIYAKQFDVLIGCASFKGADIGKHRDILSYLYDHHLADASAQPIARSENAVPITNIYRPQSEWKQAQQSIPTLMRGYLKVGAKISDRAIIDPVFNTVFVCIYANTKDLANSQQPLAKVKDTKKCVTETPSHESVVALAA